MELLKIKNRRAQGFLTENVIFVIIAVAFIAILFAFLYRASSATRMIEEGTAKKIALLLDSAGPGTIIELNINPLLEKKQISIRDIDLISITGNAVTAKLTETSGYSYSFFNKISVQKEIETLSDGKTKMLKLTITERK